MGMAQVRTTSIIPALEGSPGTLSTATTLRLFGQCSLVLGIPEECLSLIWLWAEASRISSLLFLEALTFDFEHRGCILVFCISSQDPDICAQHFPAAVNAGIGSV